MNTKRPNGSNGFTLVELLVTIVVIGLLVGIFLPVLHNVRYSAKNAKSVSNLRQIGATLHQYAADNNGYLPERLERATDANGVSYNKSYWHGKLVKTGLAPDADIFFNPKERWTSFSQWAKANGRNPDPRVSFDTQTAPVYGIRDWVILETGQSVYDPKELAAIENPAKFFLVAESWTIHYDVPSYFIGMGGVGKSWLVKVDERGVANLLFADGRVEGVTRDYFEALNETLRDDFAVSVWPEP